MPEQDAQKFTVEAVAAALRTSPEAIRKRIRRKTLSATKEGGRWVVWLSPEMLHLSEQDAKQDKHGTKQAEQDAGLSRILLLEARIEALEEALRRADAERDRLAAALEHARQQQAAHVEEVLRKDIIIQQLAQRIPALPTPEESKEKTPWWRIWKR